MTDLNSVVVVGRLTKDMEVSYMQSGTAVGKFSIAVNRSVKRNEQWTDEASFFDVTVWGKTAENLKQYLSKGKQVAIQGYLKQERWEKDGQKFSKVGIVAENIQLCGGRDGAPVQQTGGNKIAPNRVGNVEIQEDIPYESYDGESIPF